MSRHSLGYAPLPNLSEKCKNCALFLISARHCLPPTRGTTGGTAQQDPPSSSAGSAAGRVRDEEGVRGWVKAVLQPGGGGLSTVLQMTRAPIPPFTTPHHHPPTCNYTHIGTHLFHRVHHQLLPCLRPPLVHGKGSIQSRVKRAAIDARKDKAVGGEVATLGQGMQRRVWCGLEVGVGVGQDGRDIAALKPHATQGVGGQAWG
jgi:hypothetical protein